MSIPEKIFQKYDIRGIYPSELNEEATGIIVGVLATQVFRPGTVVVGRDGRNSSPTLYAAALEELKNHKEMEVIDGGIMTSPMLYFLVNHLKASGGIMITASHSPKEQNGIKVVKDGSIFVGGQEILSMMP